jgi:hypothetical protein
MYESLEPDSDVTVEGYWHPLKQVFPSLSTEEGMQIDESDEQSHKGSCFDGGKLGTGFTCDCRKRLALIETILAKPFDRAQNAN